ncbi:AAA family ATPase [Escherichia coli]|nr:AAA family ATPase [Escherichia coli]
MSTQLSFTPTDEQYAIESGYKENRFVTIQAKSGSGKTSTLYMLANGTNDSILYLAFNKSMAEEARRKMPPNVMCRTLHSICYQRLPQNLRHKLSRPEGQYVNVAGTGSEIAKKFKIQNLIDKNGKVLLTRAMIGLMVKQTLAKYEFSDDEHIGHKHFPKVHMSDLKRKNINEQKLINEVVKYAKQLWRERIDPKSETIMTHDTYVKLFELSKEDLGYDIIFGDEFQDVNPAFLSILRNAKSAKRIVVVGDEFQCVSENTLLNTEQGKVLMKDLQVGDKVESYLNGKVVFKTVTNKTLSTRTEGRNIITSKGNTLDMTHNHRIWASSYTLKEDQMIVYLMWRKDLGFRVGITNKFDDKEGFSKLGQRTRSEKAQKLWVLDIVENREAAMEKEMAYSLQYGIPTCVFEASSRSINQERVNNIFEQFGQNGFKLLEDKDYHFDYPHWHSINSSTENRKMLTVSLRAQGKKGTEVHFEWTEEEMQIFDTLVEAGVKISNAKNAGRFRVRKYFASYSEALTFAEEILTIIPFASLKESMASVDGVKYNLIPAAGLFKGMSVLVKNGDTVVAEEIVEIEDTQGFYYDVEIEDTANFFGNNILSHNCIYQFRGSSNMMVETATYGVELPLTACFRFGPKVADIANAILSDRSPLKHPLVGKGYDTVTGSFHSDVVDYSKPYTIIFRKNLTLLLEAMDRIANGEEIIINVDTKDFISMVDSVNALRRGDLDKVKHETVLPYTSWEEFVECAESDPDAKRLLNIVVSGKANNIAYTLRMHRNSPTAKVTLTTAHKSKGLEWDQVIVANDFPSNYDKKGEWVGLEESERNLLYVAHTRCIKCLQWNRTVQEILDMHRLGKSTAPVSEEDKLIAALARKINQIREDR